ncbi:SusD/RagB family nutrient-binding outer membrane lipoprotein [Flavobacterium koreense]
MKKNKFLAIAIAFVLFSCDNYLDVNDNPNQALYEDLVPSELLSAAQSNAFRTQTINMNQLGNVFSNAWAGNILQVSGGFSDEFNLNVTSSFQNGIWNNLYRSIGNFQSIIDRPNTNGEFDNYQAVAKICKAHYMQYIVDLYGNVPYSEAWKYSLNTTPKYDDDQQIYRSLIEELESARTLIDNASGNAQDVTASDVMLGGDMAKWKSFANNIELRLLIRMSNSTGAVGSYRDSKLQTLLAQNDFLIEDVKINPGYSMASNDKQNPFWGTYAYDASPAALQNYNYIAPTGHFYRATSLYSTFPTADAGSTKIQLKHGTSPTYSTVDYPNVADNRRTRIFRPGASQTIFRAVDQGFTSPNVFPPTDLGTTKTLGRQGFGTFNPYNIKGLFVDELSAVDGYVMTKSEICFLLAEAGIRKANGETGYNNFVGSASTFFSDGVQSSFDFRFASGAPAYITNVNGKLNYSITLGSFENKLHAIMFQKWIALIGIHGIESYIDYTRTGFPITPLASTAANPNKPKRLVYPVSEYVANSANVPSMGNGEVFTVNSKSPFWLLGDPALGN